ncbi:MAG: biotin/lipoyl-binding protein [Gammaproteobacteria bacterium]|jgi:multidrug efflux pump subunit AcrA (membrane-fusion protein)
MNAEPHVIRSRLRSFAHHPGLRRAGLGVAILAVGLFLAIVLIVTGPKGTPAERVERAWPVSTVVVEPRALSPTIMAFGRVEANHVAKLRTTVSAPVERVLVKEGQWVHAGDLLVALEQTELQLLVQEREAELKRRMALLQSIRNDQALAESLTSHEEQLNRIAQQKLQRHEEIFRKKMLSQALLDEVRQQASERFIALQNHLARVRDFPNQIAQHEAMVEQAKVTAERASIDLEQTRIVAPFDGPVLAVLVAPGDRTTNGSTLVEIADASGFEVRATVTSDASVRLREHLANARPVIAHSGFNSHTMSLALTRLSGNVKSGQSGLDAFFALRETSPLPDIGRVLDLRITLPPEPHVVALPVQSLYENDRIYLVEDGRLLGLDVQRVGDFVTDDGESWVLVRSPKLTAGHSVITTHLPKAMPGLKVEAMPQINQAAHAISPTAIAERSEEARVGS